MPITDSNFPLIVADLFKDLASVQATILRREVPLLAMLGALPTARGRVLEIGAFQGASTIVLSRTSRYAGDDYIWTVDPFTSPSETDPEIAESSCYPTFLNNLRATGEEPYVRVHRGLSQELARRWNEPIRALWIDGDHTYAGAKQDFDLFSPHLSDGAMIAFHDVLASQPGPARVFACDVLLSPHFGPCGVSGSIGWAQFVADPEQSTRHIAKKLRLYSAICQHAGAQALGVRLPRLAKIRYNLFRNRNRNAPSFSTFRKAVLPPRRHE